MAKPISTPAPAAQVNKWDEDLANYAKEASAKEVGGGSFLSFKAGILAFMGSEIPGSKLDVVVLGDMHENTYYDQPYDADNPISPACFAFSEDGKNMAPHPDSADPQNKDCATCKWNQFGSADNKKGKKCRNLRRIAIIPADQATDPACGLAFAKIPPTSVGNFSNHTKRVADAAHRPLWAAVTALSCKPSTKKIVEVNFAYVENITDGEQLQNIKNRVDTIQTALQVPYTYSAPEEAPPAAPSRSESKVKGRR
jgi:hypothetical protein